MWIAKLAGLLMGTSRGSAVAARRRLRRKAQRTRFESLERRDVLSTVVALNVKDQLLTIDSSAPDAIISSVDVTGLKKGEDLLGIDFRPATGELIGVGDKQRLYTIDAASGAATQIGVGKFKPKLKGDSLGVDFNPTVDRLRLVSNKDQNLRINPNTGTVVDGNATKKGVQPDGKLAYALGDVRFKKDARVVAVAYTNNFVGSTTTTLYGIDVNKDALVTIGSPGATPVSPNTGQLFTVGPLGVDVKKLAGFDIGEDGSVLASLLQDDAPSSELYTIDLATGAATLIGTIGGDRRIRDIAILPGPPPVPPTISISDASVTEDNGGPIMADFTVTISAPSSQTVTVNYATADDTALAPDDYTAQSATLTFPPNTTQMTISVPIVSDAIDEPDEQFKVLLSGATHATILDGEGVGTILDNDV